jgi:tRNA(fMet)-specific endonuclease VapC
VNGSAVALDANAAIAGLRGERQVRLTLREFHAKFIPVPVLGELWLGALNSAHPTENIQRLQRAIAEAPVLPADERTAVVYAELRADLKRRGRPIPGNDIWIAAICLQHDLPLATNDAHFQEVQGLRIVAI